MRVLHWAGSLALVFTFQACDEFQGTRTGKGSRDPVKESSLYVLASENPSFLEKGNEILDNLSTNFLIQRNLRPEQNNRQVFVKDFVGNDVEVLEAWVTIRKFYLQWSAKARADFKEWENVQDLMEHGPRPENGQENSQLLIKNEVVNLLSADPQPVAKIEVEEKPLFGAWYETYDPYYSSPIVNKGPEQLDGYGYYFKIRVGEKIIGLRHHFPIARLSPEFEEQNPKAVQNPSNLVIYTNLEALFSGIDFTLVEDKTLTFTLGERFVYPVEHEYCPPFNDYQRSINEVARVHLNICLYELMNQRNIISFVADNNNNSKLDDEDILLKQQWHPNF